MANVHAGYRGILDLDGAGTYLRFTDCSISAKQGVEIPDLVMGDWNHDNYAYGKIEVNGSISGLVDEGFSNTIWDWGYVRNSPCGLINPKSPHLYYYCDDSDTTKKRDIAFTDLFVNSLNFTVAAGDIANWSVDVIGRRASAFTNTDAPHFTDTKKLITWDKVGVSISASSDTPTPCAPVVLAYQNLEFTVANNVELVYAIVPSTDPDWGLFPYQAVPGIRTITGSLTGFDIDDQFAGFDNWDAYQTQSPASGLNIITFSIGALTVKFAVRFHRIEPTIGVGPVTSTIAFSGVGYQEAVP